MKLKYFLAIAGFAMAISSCDEGTDNIGMSLISSNDDISVTTQEFDVVTASYIPDSVYTYNNELYVGHVTDPETNATVDCSFMMQFNMMEETHLPDKEYIISREDNEIIADSCLVILFFNYCYGDSTTAMKIRISELDHPVADGIHYSNFDPVKGGYIRKGGLSQSHMFTIDDMTVKDSIKNLSTYDRNVMFRLNSPYTDKNGVRYKNYGTYILRNYYEHPDYFKNSYAFIHQLCPGFYIETTDGQGVMANFLQAQLRVYYTEKGTDDNTYVSYLSASSTDEVLQTITVKNDKETLQKLVESDNDYTYLKTPVGIFTEVTFPVDEIKTAHVKDSLLSVSISFNRENNSEPLTKYTFSSPKKVLLIEKDSLNSFFEQVSNYNNKYAFYTTLSKNAYTFSNSNDINNLIVRMYNARQAGEKNDPLWLEKHPDWNKALLLPVNELTTLSSSTSTVGTTIALINEMGLTSTRLKRGTPSNPIKLKVIYARFNN